MASKKEVYVTIMYRWGNQENHSYLLGVYNKKYKAIEEGIKEESNRGKKYSPQVYEVLINETKIRKIVHRMEDYWELTK